MIWFPLGKTRFLLIPGLRCSALLPASIARFPSQQTEKLHTQFPRGKGWFSKESTWGREALRSKEWIYFLDWKHTYAPQEAKQKFPRREFQKLEERSLSSFSLRVTSLRCSLWNRLRADILFQILFFQWLSFHFMVHLGLPGFAHGAPSGQCVWWSQSEPVFIALQTQLNRRGSGVDSSSSPTTGSWVSDAPQRRWSLGPRKMILSPQHLGLWVWL